MPTSLRAIASDLGISVRLEILDQDDPGHMVKNGESLSGYSILVNSSQDLHSQRFVLAKEIAHFALHRDLFENGIVEDTNTIRLKSPWFETQANLFAAHILMPASAMVVFCNKYKLDANDLSKYFNVSMELALTHLERLGCPC